MKGVDRKEKHDVIALTDQRKRKGKKYSEFKVQWANHPETWESEHILKEDIPELIEQFFY